MNLRFNREIVICESASSSLTHLALDACFSVDLAQLLYLCSNLISLTVRVEQSRRRYPLLSIPNADKPLHRHQLSAILCPYLTYFSLDINDLSLGDVKGFLIAMPYLQHFRLEGLTYDMDFSKGDLWESILENRTKKLKQFDMAGLRVWLGNNADDDLENTHLVEHVSHSFGPGHRYWGKCWSVCQTHKLRPNHLNLTLHARAL